MIQKKEIDEMIGELQDQRKNLSTVQLYRIEDLVKHEKQRRISEYTYY